MARLPRLPRRVLAGLACALLGLGLGALWFRDSSFAQVERVSITGSTSSEAAQVRETLQSVGEGMSTLHVDEGALHDAVEPFTSVAGLRIRPDFPHDLRIEVLEHAPVAAVENGGGRGPPPRPRLLPPGGPAHHPPGLAPQGT